MKSVRRSSQEIGISRSTMQDILKQEHFHPYKLQILHKLTEDDPDRQLEMCHWLLEHPMLCQDMLFSNEANFYVNGKVNKQNCQYYSQSNPHWMEACREHSSTKIMVWCGLWKKHILGPFFFLSNLTGEAYLQMLQDDLLPQINSLCDGYPTWFMQDGAPPHYAKVVCEWLDLNFDNWIGHRGTVEWAPRSPNLNPLDFSFGDMSSIWCTP